MLFKRKVVVVIGNRQFDYDDWEIEFDLDISNKPLSSKSMVAIYNMSTRTINKILPGDRVIITAGYEGDVISAVNGFATPIPTAAPKSFSADFSGYEGQPVPIFKGFVEDIITTNNIDRRTEITLALRPTSNQQALTTTYRPGIHYFDIFRNISRVTGVSITIRPGVLNIANLYGKSVLGPIAGTIIEMASDLGAVATFVDEGYIIHLAGETLDDSISELSASSGLLESPEKIESTQGAISVDAATRVETVLTPSLGKHKVKSLLFNSARVGGRVSIRSSTLNGTVIIERYKHKLIGDDYTTEMEVVK